MVPRWSRDGPEKNRTLIAFAIGRAGPYRTLRYRTGGALQDAHCIRYRTLASELED